MPKGPVSQCILEFDTAENACSFVYAAAERGICVLCSTSTMVMLLDNRESIENLALISPGTKKCEFKNLRKSQEKAPQIN